MVVQTRWQRLAAVIVLEKQVVRYAGDDQGAIAAGGWIESTPVGGKVE